MTKVLPKKTVQDIRKQLLANGYTVTKLNSGYEVVHNGVTIFKAMQGINSYLVRYANNLFE